MIDWVDHLMWERIIPFCGAIIGLTLVVFFHGRWQNHKQTKKENIQ